MGKNVLAVIEDDPEYRAVFQEVARGVIGESWDLIIPDTLGDLLKEIRLRIADLRILFVDYKINSSGYQRLLDDDMTYADRRGSEVALGIRDLNPGIKIVGFSRGNNIHMVGISDCDFPSKTCLLTDDAVKQELADFIRRLTQ